MLRIMSFVHMSIVIGALINAVHVMAAENELPRLKVLFLGDHGPHAPADRFAQLAPTMANRGIELVYTDKLSDLNTTTLGRYDTLAIYANIDEISRDAEAALIGYVEGGGGLVALHCASYCFRNSPAYVGLVGGQFQRHGYLAFETIVADQAHPIMKGLEPFRTEDETYVHTAHNPQNRIVLQTRAEGAGEEPWTWIRTQGKGRVFYTAYGHDAKTWGHYGFHDLVERGIRWASAKGPVVDSRPQVPEGATPFEYKTAIDPIPNYVVSAKWGEQGEPLNRIQKPLESVQSMTHVALPSDFELKLFASEPQIYKPITMAWDHRGRLWIAETIDYPNELRPPGHGRDRISICEDTDGDGQADKFTVFADQLSIPTSITFANGGVIVHQAPATLFLQDTDGDDKADVRRVLFSGWNTADTHAGPSNMRYGFDNWIWGIVGYSGFKGTVSGENVEFRTGFYRFKPDGSKIEFLRNTNNNSWGVGQSEEGLTFGSTANGCPSVFLPIPNRYYESVRGWSSNVLQSIADSNRIFPVTRNVRQVDWHGGFTAGAGHALYTARAYPKQYWNNVAFVTESTGHLVATFALNRKGSDYRAHNSWNLFASDDEWTSPIMAEVGPDGYVWVIDWYNYIVQHNPTPKGFERGPGNAYVTRLRDKTHGRIYRIVPKGAARAKPFALDPQQSDSLVEALSNDNLFWRLHAQRLLVERSGHDVVPALIKRLADQSFDEIGINPGAIHALRVLDGLYAIQGEALDAVVMALNHPSAAVRRNAVEVLTRDHSSADRLVASNVLRDADPQVKLAALLALSEMPHSASAANAIVNLYLQGDIGTDRWLGDAATIAAAAHNWHFLNSVAKLGDIEKKSSHIATAIRRVAEHTARGPVESSELSSLLVTLQSASPTIIDEIILGFLAGWPKDGAASLTEVADLALPKIFARVSNAARGPLVSLAARWHVKSLDRYAAEITAELVSTVRDEKLTDDRRLTAARQLMEFRAADANAANELFELIAPQSTPEFASGLIEAVCRSESLETAKLLASRASALTPVARGRAIRGLLGKVDWTSVLLDAIEHGDLSLSLLSLDERQGLASHPNKTVAGRATTLMKQGGGLPDPDRQKVIDTISPLVLRSADAVKGKEIYKAQCAKCHSHSGEGGKIGPDLTGMAVHPKEELLIHLLDPSRSVEGNFLQYTLATKDGRVLNGLLASESRTAVELVDAEGKTRPVLRSDIDELIPSKKSLMPEGFENQVGPDAIADLLEFLTQRGKYLPIDLRKDATVISTQGMFYDRNSLVERMIFPDWSPKVFAGIPFYLVDPSNDRVPNAILLYSRNGAIPLSMPKSVTLPCRSAAKRIHLLSGVSGWGANSPDASHTVSMTVRLHYSGGQTEDHTLLNGVHFADYIRRIDVPGSMFAFALRDQQIRYLQLAPKQQQTIDRIELIKGEDDTAPIVMAVTVETE